MRVRCAFWFFGIKKKEKKNGTLSTHGSCEPEKTYRITSAGKHSVGMADWSSNDTRKRKWRLRTFYVRQIHFPQKRWRNVSLRALRIPSTISSAIGLIPNAARGWKRKRKKKERSLVILRFVPNFSIYSFLFHCALFLREHRRWLQPALRDARLFATTFHISRELQDDKQKTVET